MMNENYEYSPAVFRELAEALELMQAHRSRRRGAALRQADGGYRKHPRVCRDTGGKRGRVEDDMTVSNKLQEWQERLGLTDWAIRLHDCLPTGEMTEENVAGVTEFQEVNKCARIEIMDPDEYGDRVIPFDYERILVHELLHLKLCLISETLGEDILQERVAHQLIDDLARALVDAKYSGVEYE